MLKWLAVNLQRWVWPCLINPFILHLNIHVKIMPSSFLCYSSSERKQTWNSKQRQSTEFMIAFLLLQVGRKVFNRKLVNLFPALKNNPTNKTSLNRRGGKCHKSSPGKHVWLTISATNLHHQPRKSPITKPTPEYLLAQTEAPHWPNMTSSTGIYTTSSALLHYHSSFRWKLVRTATWYSNSLKIVRNSAERIHFLNPNFQFEEKNHQT